MDVQNAEIVFEFLKTLTHQGNTVLVVCHDSELASRHANGAHLYLEMDGEGVRRLKRIDKAI